MTTTDRPGALEGVRIIDLSQFVLGPYATQMLGDLGADVIKVEEPSGDRQRNSGKGPIREMGPGYVAFNRNKRSVALDLKTDEARAALTELVRTGDVFIHNMRPSAIARLGFGYDQVKAIRPDIVYVEAMGYDDAGPYAGLQAFDDLIQSASGACGLGQLVDPYTELRPLPSLIADKTCGLFAVIATLAALRHKERTGEGQFVQVPMLETFTGFIMAEHLYGQTFVPPTGGFGFTTAITPHRKPLRTRDGWVTVLPASQVQSAKFMELGGLPGAYELERFTSKASGKEKVAEYYAMMAEAAASHTTAEWMALGAEHSIPIMRANTPMQIFEDDQLKQTLFEERSLGEAGAYRAIKPGLRFSATPASIRRDPPRVGQDTAEVLGEAGIAGPAAG